MNVIVTGGRAYRNKAHVWRTLDCLEDITLLAHGGAQGADEHAALWAARRRVPARSYPVDETTWQRVGPKAGPLRNAQMLAEVQPRLVVAFPGGRDAQSMMALARRAGVDVLVAVERPQDRAERQRVAVRFLRESLQQFDSIYRERDVVLLSREAVESLFELADEAVHKGAAAVASPAGIQPDCEDLRCRPSPAV